jgi:hypothetical protein
VGERWLLSPQRESAPRVSDLCVSRLDSRLRGNDGILEFHFSGRFPDCVNPARHVIPAQAGIHSLANVAM